MRHVRKIIFLGCPDVLGSPLKLSEFSICEIGYDTLVFSVLLASSKSTL